MLGEIISGSFKNFNYYSVLKNSINFQKRDENKNFSLATVSKEIAISRIESNDPQLISMEDSKEVKENNMNTEKIVNNDESLNEDAKSEIEKIPISLPTEVIQANNLVESYNTIYHDIKIKNETNFNLSQELLTPNVNFSDKSNILIFHTHTCESYTPTKANSYIASRKL